MAKYGPSTVSVAIEDSPGGTSRDITPYVRSIGGVAVESITVQSNPFGVGYESHTPIGVEKTPDIPISGFYDDTATTGIKAVFFTAATWALDKAPGSAGRELIIVCATGLTFTIHVHLVRVEAGPKTDGLTEYTALVRQMGQGVWS